MEGQRSIVIIGAGISGLSLGAYIKDGGFNSIILEKSSRAGGVLQSANKNGYQLDYGANTCSSNRAIEEMIEILGLQDKVVRPNANGNKRYLVKKGKLKALSPKPKDLLTTSLLSTSAKVNIFKEQFKKAGDGYLEESVGEFFERRFGQEVVDQVINPMIGGIYAGDPYKLSMQSVFPQLLEMEREHGSIIKALKKKKGEMPKREIISFDGGMQTLINALEEYIGKDNILLETEVTKVRPLENGQYAIQLTQADLDLEIVADVVVFATPSYVTAEFLRPFSFELAELMKLHHPKMAVVHLGFDKSALKKPFDSFGFLVPEKEEKSLLGAIANSSFLEGKAPEGKELFTLFVGGTRQEQALEANQESLIQQAIEDFKEIMKISAEPELKETFIWDKAIPQFDVGVHQQMLEGFGFFETNTENLHILGNYRSGVSVGDCIQGAKKAHGTLIKDYSRQSFNKANLES